MLARSALGLVCLLVVWLAPLLCSGQTLKQAAAGKVYIGAAASYDHIVADSKYNSTLVAHYGLITAENGCKWDAMRPSKTTYDYSQCDKHFQYSRTHNMLFRGHTLAWGSQNPSWLTNGGFTAAQKKSILQDHITQVVKHYGNGLYCWDVVNEAVTDDSSSTVFKNNIWYPAVPDYVDFAFKTARAANPNVKLFYNDYNIDSATGWSKTKSDKVFNMISSMKSRGIPIDGVGFQMHVDLNFGSMIAGVKQNIARYANIGIEVHFTEIDVACGASGTTCTWTAAKEATQAKIYQDLLAACLSYKNCKVFETWGFTDKFTWLTNQHPLPFDANYNKKAAFNSLLSYLQSH